MTSKLILNKNNKDTKIKINMIIAANNNNNNYYYYN